VLRKQRNTLRYDTVEVENRLYFQMRIEVSRLRLPVCRWETRYDVTTSTKWKMSSLILEGEHSLANARNQKYFHDQSCGNQACMAGTLKHRPWQDWVFKFTGRLHLHFLLWFLLRCSPSDGCERIDEYKCSEYMNHRYELISTLITRSHPSEDENRRCATGLKMKENEWSLHQYDTSLCGNPIKFHRRK
jgi:hypothetical protein